MISLKELKKIRKQLFADSEKLVKSKGHDYNKTQQQAGDTLFNLRVPALLGNVSSPTQTCIDYMSAKLMRLTSLQFTDPKVKGESFRDTILDMINYTTYLYAFYKEKNNAIY